jgi:uridine kinase
MFSDGPRIESLIGGKNMEPVVIGVAGGSGSGKTSVTREILKIAGADRVRCISHDSYYRDREAVNFDHPDALETELMAEHLRALLSGQTIEIPIYDFATHTRGDETLSCEPSPVIIVEGLLIFWEEALRMLFDLKVFVDTSDDLRIIRRIQRDTAERERDVDSVIQQYLESVRPMHLEFVEPSKRYADVIIPYDGHNPAAVDLISGRLRALLDAHGA